MIRLTCAGHANFGNDDSSDLVCAAVSALTGFLGLTFTEVLGCQGSVTASDGHFSLDLAIPQPAQIQSSIDTVTSGWILAVKALEENYSGWVKVAELET